MATKKHDFAFINYAWKGIKHGCLSPHSQQDFPSYIIYHLCICNPISQSCIFTAVPFCKLYKYSPSSFAFQRQIYAPHLFKNFVDSLYTSKTA